ncbi:non-canonical purine NTP pyrophosphatase [Cordyceps fumosorosea ARSEF 2679]|uniref:Non-canonical purine NTP pyrophosphatase n=1 Tax=Cordyceps fumosorosea (strain ARSEF 2679) TaxID=1081104 RepID=A0A167YDW0_CORFA|nr:non-canonical purine NTP pyrophosphatase [Cordyceps fumosorosea ARSEF 2679]OAA66218.1 non-canonical purine NTP pyrophosphatase [Cordyceps fumosorosea ARSEF 2679]
MAPCVHFITGNANKLREVKAILEPEIEVQSHAIDLEEVQGSVEEVTLSKCRRAAEICISSKWFLTTTGLNGLNNLLAAYSDKSAEAVCTFGYSEGKGKTPILFQGRCPGKIVFPRGSTRFGWDPIFEHDGKTFAEMEPEEKNQISHRAKALARLREHFQEHV